MGLHLSPGLIERWCLRQHPSIQAFRKKHRRICQNESVAYPVKDSLSSKGASKQSQAIIHCLPHCRYHVTYTSFGLFLPLLLCPWSLSGVRL